MNKPRRIKGETQETSKPEASAGEGDSTRARRALCTAMRFWAVCPGRHCRRVRACAGDADACLLRLWPMVSEEDKVWLRAGIRARAEGLPLDEAFRFADAELKRYLAQTASLAADASAPAGVAPASAAEAEDIRHSLDQPPDGGGRVRIGPRVRLP